MADQPEWIEVKLILRYRPSVLTPGGESRNEPSDEDELIEEIDRAMNSSHFGGQIEVRRDPRHDWTPGMHAQRAHWDAMTSGEIPRPKCVQCGETVEVERIVYASPTCYACLPPPRLTKEKEDK